MIIPDIINKKLGCFSVSSFVVQTLLLWLLIKKENRDSILVLFASNILCIDNIAWWKGKVLM